MIGFVPARKGRLGVAEREAEEPVGGRETRRVCFDTEATEE